MTTRAIITTTAAELAIAADLSRAGQVANAIAAQNVFTDYRSRRAANTIRRQTEDLALFAEMLNAVSLNAAASLDDLLTDNDLTTTPDAWHNVTWGLVKLFVNWQLQRGFAIGTINVRLSTIKTYAKLAVKAGTLGTTEYALIRAVNGYRHSEGRHIDEARATTRRSTKKAEATTLTPEQAAQLKAPLVGHAARPPRCRDAEPHVEPGPARGRDCGVESEEPRCQNRLHHVLAREGGQDADPSVSQWPVERREELRGGRRRVH